MSKKARHKQVISALVGVVLSTVAAISGPIVAHADYGDVWASSHAFNKMRGNYTGIHVTYQVPDASAYMPPTSQWPGCINYPIWILYPTFDHWLEMGIQHCWNEAADIYHVYEYSRLLNEWGPVATQFRSGNTVTLAMTKVDSSTWAMWVNGQRVTDAQGNPWPPSNSVYTVALDRIEVGLESQSVTYRSPRGALRDIWIQNSIGWGWVLASRWEPSDDLGRRYYISGTPSNFEVWGYGLPTKTGWHGSASGIGSRFIHSTQEGAERQAERFAGHTGIDLFQTLTSPDGQTKGYAIGLHSADIIEYVMQFPYKIDPRIWTLGLADKPGPVLANVYIDAQYVGQVSFNHNDNNHHLGIPAPLVVQMPNSYWEGAHSLALEFANDYCNYNPYDPDQDRNFYLDAIGVTAW